MDRDIVIDFSEKNSIYDLDFKMEVKLLRDEIEYIEDLINDITFKFKEIIKDINNSFTFIPKKGEIIYDEDNFIDLFYYPEFVNYPNEQLLKFEEDNYLNEDNEIGKNLFYAKIEDEKLILKFISLFVLTEDNNIELIWDFNEGEIKKIFIEFITNLIKNK